MKLRVEVDSPMNHPNTINTFDCINFEHDTIKGKGGLQNLTVLNAQQSLGISDDKRYNTSISGLFINKRAGSSAIML